MIAFNEALVSAGKFAKSINEACERLAVVGSLRRGESAVSNLDFVVMPRAGKIYDNGVFELIDTWTENGFTKKALNKNGSPIAWAGNTKRALLFYDSLYHRWTPVNVYVASRQTWALMLVLLSGEQPFTTALVTPQAKGGAMPADRIVRQWRIWSIPRGLSVPKDKAPQEGYALNTPFESDVFESLNLPYIAPPLRQEKTLQQWLKFKPSGYLLTDLYQAMYNASPGLEIDKGGHWRYYGERIESPQGLTFCNGAFYRHGVKIKIPKDKSRLITARINAGVTGSPGWVCVGGEPYELIYAPADKTGERFTYSIRTLINHSNEETARHERNPKDN